MSAGVECCRADKPTMDEVGISTRSTRLQEQSVLVFCAAVVSDQLPCGKTAGEHQEVVLDVTAKAVQFLTKGCYQMCTSSGGSRM